MREEESCLVKFCQSRIYLLVLSEITNMKKIILLFAIMLTCNNNCLEDDTKKSEETVGYFRKRLEEIENRTCSIHDRPIDPNSNLVQYLIKNAHEIFHDIKKTTERDIISELPEIILVQRQINNTPGSPSQLVNNTSTILALTNDVVDSFTSTSTAVIDVMLNTNITSAILLDSNDITIEELSQKTQKDELLHLIKDVRHISETNEKFVLTEKVNSSIRTCVTCNNLWMEDCANPRNKLIPSVLCERDDDVCYFLDTPFGIIDRGCFNVDRNISTYVCSCNLCNHISISDMPHIFSSKQDWADDVIELTRMRDLRKSVHKDMSCLKCEVNAAATVGDMLDSANCMEGQIGNLPVEACKEDEVCAVKAIKKDGYVWRGCTKFPL